MLFLLLVTTENQIWRDMLKSSLRFACLAWWFLYDLFLFVVNSLQLKHQAEGLVEQITKSLIPNSIFSIL